MFNCNIKFWYSHLVQQLLIVLKLIFFKFIMDIDKFGVVKPYNTALTGSQILLKSHQIKMAEMRRLLKQNRASNQLIVKITEDNGRDPVLLFPAEIWEKILDDVTESVDLENCSLTCQLFQRILKPRRAEWMFSKAFPFLYHHLDKASILNCRLTCKNWTNSIDNYINQILSSPKLLPTYTKIHTLFIQKRLSSSFHHHLPITGYYFPHFNVEVRQDQLTYTSRQGIPLLPITTSMELSQRNPFLGRLVVFLDVIFTQDIVNQAIQLFENCGHHIWYLELSLPLNFTEADIDLKELKRFFTEGLPKMPNLKKMDLLMTRKFVEAHLLSIMEQSCKSLQSLSISQVPDSENRALEYTTLSTLALSPVIQQLHSLELITFELQYFEGSSWSNLKFLKLGNLDTPGMLSGLSQLNLQTLKSLLIHFCYGYPEDPQLLEKLLQISNNFSNLTCLEILNTPKIPESPEILQALPTDLYAPMHLSELTVHFKDSNYPNVLTFLLRFPLLKKLYIKNLHDNSKLFRRTHLKGSDMDIMGVYFAMSSRCIDDVDELMYEQDVWKLLPFLEVLGVILQRSVKDKVVVFTRQGYTFRRSEKFVERMMPRNDLPFPGMGPELEDFWE